MIIAILFAAAVTLADRPAAVVPAADQAMYKAWLADQALDVEASFALKDRCSAAAVRDAATHVITLSNPPPGVRGQALAESVVVEGCGRKLRVNLNVLAPLQGMGWQGNPSLPGESLASLGLQEQASREMVPTLNSRRTADCDRIVVGEAQVVARPGAVRLLAQGALLPKAPPAGVVYRVLADPAAQAQIAEEKSWIERWSLNACGRDASMTILFGPAREGPVTYLFISPAWQETATPPAAK